MSALGKLRQTRASLRSEIMESAVVFIDEKMAVEILDEIEIKPACETGSAYALKETFEKSHFFEAFCAYDRYREVCNEIAELESHLVTRPILIPV